MEEKLKELKDGDVLYAGGYNKLVRGIKNLQKKIMGGEKKSRRLKSFKAFEINEISKTIKENKKKFKLKTSINCAIILLVIFFFVWSVLTKSLIFYIIAILTALVSVIVLGSIYETKKFKYGTLDFFRSLSYFFNKLDAAFKKENNTKEIKKITRYLNRTSGQFFLIDNKKNFSIGSINFSFLGENVDYSEKLYLISKKMGQIIRDKKMEKLKENNFNFLSKLFASNAFFNDAIKIEIDKLKENVESIETKNFIRKCVEVFRKINKELIFLGLAVFLCSLAGVILFYVPALKDVQLDTKVTIIAFIFIAFIPVYATYKKK